MSSRQQQRLAEGMAGLLEPGEEVVQTLVAQAAGTSRSRATRGVVGGAVGTVVGDAMHKQPQATHAAAADQGLVIRSPMGLVLTNRRIMTVQIDAMSRGNVKEVLSSVPLDAVDAVTRKKSFGLLGAKVAVTVRGTDIDLECTSKSEVEGLVAAFVATKNGAPPPS
jgi:hypothetical protein